MVFADLFFIYVFLPLCLICYGLAKKLSTKNIVLIVFSLIFYAWGEPLWILLLLFSSFFNWFIGILIGKFRDTPRAKLAVGGGILVDILLLLIFKYSAFIVENLNAVSGAAIPVPQITLPIGISFYTFQAISYILDCYWETVDVQPKYHKFLLYLSLFPQLIAGPIVRYSVVEQEIDNRSVNATDLCEGALRVILGLAKKVIIANNLWSIVNTFFGKDITGLSVLGTWYTIIVYSLYVYFDFSGYSDIAIGLGRMFGFRFDENFRHPFACTTIAEFWQRWHISLGCFMLFEQKMGKKRMKKWPIVWKHVYTKLVIILGFGIFYFEDLGQLSQFFLNITGISMIANSAPFTDPMTFSSLRNNIFLILFAILVSLPVLPKIKSYFLVYTIGRVGSVAVCMVLLAVVSVLLVDTTNNVFLYFRF